jgi:hypothetical protein
VIYEVQFQRSSSCVSYFIDIQSVPVQAVVALFGVLLSIIGGFILWVLTKLQSEIKDSKDLILKLETKMVSELEKKADKSIIETRLSNIESGINDLRQIIPKVNQIAEDIAFLKGKEEARREMLSK